LWEENQLPTFNFSWLTRNDVATVITNNIQPLLVSTGLDQFYYANFPRPNLTVLNFTWNQSTTLANETTGYFVNALGFPAAIGTYSSTVGKYIQVGSLVQFVPPTGYYFDANNRLKLGTPSQDNDKLMIWASPTAIVLDGTNQGQGNFSNGTGPVTLNNFVPTGAIPVAVIPLLVTNLPNTTVSTITDQIVLYRNFGLGYDNATATWYVITSTNLDVNAPFSLANAQNTSGTNQDASWLIQFVTNGTTYTVTSRALFYLFGSVLQTRFFFETNQRIYDSRTGTVIADFVNVLKTNSRPDTNVPLPGDIKMAIVGQPVASDGFVDDYQVFVSYQDADNDGVPDDPDFFDEIVAPDVNPTTKFVFFEKTVDFDNLQRYLLVEPGRVISEYATKDDISAVLLQFVPGQVFYAYGVYNTSTNTYTTNPAFYQLVISGTGVRSLIEVSDEWLARVGRQSLYYQYRHNAALTSRIDPGTTNIIDLYVVSQAYYTAYQNWLRDVTDTVPKPAVPTIDELNTAYQGLNDYKMISDNVIVNSVVFKPLFGPKAAKELQATIKVIRAADSTASESEIKNLVVANLNTYFSIDKWDFGQTFYFSELAAYIHSNMGGVVSSVVLVPLDPLKSFGDLYEIRSGPSEIFVNGAGVNSVEVITALTSTNIRTAPGSGVI
jgi:hypothetical protein